MNQIEPGKAPRLPMTSQSLGDTLEQRFGERIKTTVLSSLDIDRFDTSLDLEVIERAITMALDAELMVAGASFAICASMSALAVSPGFRRAAERVGVVPDSLDVEQRLRIDASFSRKWRERFGGRTSAADEQLAQSVMADVLLRGAY